MQRVLALFQSQRSCSCEVHKSNSAAEAGNKILDGLSRFSLVGVRKRMDSNAGFGE